MQSEPMNRQTSVNQINEAAFVSPEVVAWYENLDFILKPEEVILGKIGSTIKDKKLLDIGLAAAAPRSSCWS
jgi:hypothetical protein